jgi:hypothetical protein
MYLIDDEVEASCQVSIVDLVWKDTYRSAPLVITDITGKSIFTQESRCVVLGPLRCRYLPQALKADSRTPQLFCLHAAVLIFGLAIVSHLRSIGFILVLFSSRAHCYV